MSIKTEPYYFAVVNENGRLLGSTVRSRAQDARAALLLFDDWKNFAQRGWRVVKVVVSEYEPANNEAVRIAELERERDALIRDNASYVEAAASEASRAEAAEALLREAREALEPFAPSDEAMAEALWRGLSGMAAGSVAVKLYDFSRASALLTKINEALK